MSSPPPNNDEAASARKRRRVKGSVIALIGYMLSPLSWWNDLLVNVPLALAFAWIISLFIPSIFAPSFVVGYWLTNILGFVLMHYGGSRMVTGEPVPFSGRAFISYLLISIGYTLLIVALIWLGLLQPLPEYFSGKK